eukprot:8728007-Karenia_brevis.AAC.1
MCQAAQSRQVPHGPITHQRPSNAPFCLILFVLSLVTAATAYGSQTGSPVWGNSLRCKAVRIR